MTIFAFVTFKVLAATNTVEIISANTSNSSVTFISNLQTNTSYCVVGTSHMTNNTEWFQITDYFAYTNDVMTVKIDPKYIRILDNGYVRIRARKTK